MNSTMSFVFQNIKGAARKLDRVDFLVIAVHILICSVIAVIVSQNLFQTQLDKAVFGNYFTIVSLMVSLTCYHRLQNILFYTIWLIIGAIQFYSYPWINSIASTNNNFDGLLSLLPTLLMLQLLRHAFYMIYNMELIIVTNSIRFFTQKRKRELLSLDIFFSLVLIATAIFSPIYLKGL